jgi:hypothetical protein
MGKSGVESKMKKQRYDLNEDDAEGKKNFAGEIIGSPADVAAASK